MVVQKAVKTLNADLLNERNRGTFNVEELTNLIDGGAEKTKERRELVEFFVKDPLLHDKVPPEYLSYVERYEEAIRKSCLMVGKINEWIDLKKTGSSVELYQAILGGMLGSAILKDGMPFALHYVMFIPAILGQGTLEQQAYWIGRAWNCQIMGTYAQTELGHGTFIRGLETTAHYDPTTEEFILNSPTLTSYKWWPGGLGQTSNYAIVVAQLYTKGECHGIHPFVVQLRDEESHMPLPGIDIGEIGCKMGMNGTNQGYLGFKKFRIPRDQMLMKNSQVLKDGTYVKSPSDKLTYGTMIFVRVALIKGVSLSYLSKAVTIATRYSAVRRQSELRPGEAEPLIMEYKTQQYKLFPNIASAFGMLFSANWLWSMYHSVTSELEQGDLERLPEMHAIACCLKAVSTSDAARGIEECRKACGGHGYMTCSNLPFSYGMATAAETYEGENTVLYLQTARFLMKAWYQARTGTKLPLTTAYLTQNESLTKFPWSNTMLNVIAAYRQVAYGLIKETTGKVDRMIATGVQQEDAWNNYSISLVQCAQAHCRLFMIEKFFASVKEANVSPHLRTVLMQLCELYGVYFLLNNLGFFLMYSSVRIGDISSIQDWQDSLLAVLRPNAVSIVDSFDICDEILSSPLGAYDGNVYERLFEEANKSPLNAKPVNSSFEKYLKPFLKSNL
ncbi:probable peroxisomal acyl-coenzyme A oxidase 1 [Cimex lectularius]|uniref:Acyl-coenzyme A oxidase n=1 Tax=Cimex lectularius TaxID=79782 RepID=A0A8I6R9P5_CIMLE|nr:probable peroxisomal acyl-coenzyme A oxidase 1 [Cimex lectularius]